MYDFMDRSAVNAMYRRGISKSEIDRQLGIDRKTVRRILKESCQKEYVRRPGGSLVDTFRDDIFKWLDARIPITRMLEMARENPDRPYTGSRTAFFDRVKLFRRDWQRERNECGAWLRFEGLPGEYVQVDWGEIRKFPFLRQESATRYFFCARLKFSRYLYVEFTDNMRFETLIRCFIRAFEDFGGVPFTGIFDNMKTVTIGRDGENKPVWNDRFLKFALEMEFHPEVCHPYSGNQKGTVENLVKWVKSNFLPGREFLDDEDLSAQLRDWLMKKNNSISQSHGKVPAELLTSERSKFIPLRTDSSSYGIFGQAVVGPESLVNVDGSRYSVPVGYVGRTLTVRIRKTGIDFYDGSELAASHRRVAASKKPVIIPEHFEPVFRKKPRGRVMIYRDYLMSLDRSIEGYIGELCRRFRSSFDCHILNRSLPTNSHKSHTCAIRAFLTEFYGHYIIFVIT